ncbi:HupE/UreJ family protein [Pseudahrensia aquimaris]|uniref:HupE/UreJ family protein n=1 Tax=Pseudahrensia aquimaris TaxID=744461 RepID=A0ABW3FBJ8_9HYPH
MRRLPLFGFALAFVLSFVASVYAHEIRPAIFELTLNEDRSFQLDVSANIEAIVADIGSEHEDTSESPNAQRYNELRTLEPAALEEAFRAVAPDWLAAVGLSFGDSTAAFDIAGMTIPEVGDTELARLSTLQLTGMVPEGTQTVAWAYASRYGASILRINRPGQEQFAQFFNTGAESGPMDLSVAEERTFWGTVSYYLYQGFVHIIPAGLDHILFVLGLFLLSQSWKPLLAQVTAFTIAHTITLALSVNGVVALAPSIVEPLIALSIVYVAVENILTQKLHIWRPIIVFLFGLLHGMGFAGVLGEVGLPADYFATALISFNVGVEIGQLAVIAIAFALVGWFMRKSWYRRLIVIPASLGIAAMGAFWFFERTGFIGA